MPKLADNKFVAKLLIEDSQICLPPYDDEKGAMRDLMHQILVSTVIYGRQKKHVRGDIPSLPSDNATALRDRAVVVCAPGGEDEIVGGVVIGLRCGRVLGGSANELRVRFLVEDSKPPIDGRNMPEWRSGKKDIGAGIWSSKLLKLPVELPLPRVC